MLTHSEKCMAYLKLRDGHHLKLTEVLSGVPCHLTSRRTVPWVQGCDMRERQGIGNASPGNRIWPRHDASVEV